MSFLDSAMRHSRLGRYSYVAADPFATFGSASGQAWWNGQPVEGEPLQVLASRLATYRQQAIEGLPPFQSGAVGFFAYDLASELERLPQVAPPRCGPVLAISFAFYDVVCAFDHETEQAWLIATGLPERSGRLRADRAQARAARVRAALAGNAVPAPANAPAIPRNAWTSNFTQAQYEDAVAAVKEAILDGDIFQANIAQRFVTALPAGFCPWAFYGKLRKANAATFAAFLERDGLAVASSSPERFVAVTSGAVESRPIKGTSRRAADPAEDAALAGALAASGKDRAENIMIVDLMRNDLSRVCEPGSVDVPSLCEVESYAGVHHLVSSVMGTLRRDRTIADLVRAGFPGGSITGAPKVKAMEIIAATEKEQRGVYCGSIGYLGLDGRSDLNIAIRTVVFQNGVASFHAGGGITALSDPGAEYAETLDKAEKIFGAFRLEPEVQAE